MSELKESVQNLQERFAALKNLFDLDGKQKLVNDLESQTQASGFWNDQETAQGIAKKLGRLKEDVDAYVAVLTELQELVEFADLEDANLDDEIRKKAAALEKRVAALEELQMFAGKYDDADCLLSIHAGTGGLDAQDWAQMLERMYLRYCDTSGWSATIIERLPGDDGGIKTVSMQIAGVRAYGHLQAEHGVHRLVRLSPFNIKHTRETSFVLVEVVPLFDHSTEVTIDPSEIRLDTFRSRGHGGQSVNTTDSAVRITHLPTGIVVSCQNERSQLQNKRIAMQILESKLALLQQASNEEEVRQAKGEYKQGSWGNQIRSYVLQPYTMVKDHRTEYETSNVQAVLDGDLDGFIKAWLTRGTSDSMK